MQHPSNLFFLSQYMNIWIQKISEAQYEAWHLNTYPFIYLNLHKIQCDQITVKLDCGLDQSSTVMVGEKEEERGVKKPGVSYFILFIPRAESIGSSKLWGVDTRS